MKKQKLKERENNSKGITLVALIITIVVLLILAVVSIGAIQKSGIFGHAEKASSEYTIGQEREKINVSTDEWLIKTSDTNSKSNQTFKDFMTEKLEGEATVSGDDNGPVTVKFNKTGHEYVVTQNGEKNEDTIKKLEEIVSEFGEKYINAQNITDEEAQKAAILDAEEKMKTDLEGEDAIFYYVVNPEGTGLEGGIIISKKAKAIFLVAIEFAEDDSTKIYLLESGLEYNEWILKEFNYTDLMLFIFGQSEEFIFDGKPYQLLASDDKKFVIYNSESNIALELEVWTGGILAKGIEKLEAEIPELFLLIVNAKEVDPDGPFFGKYEGRYVKYDSDGDGKVDDEILYRILYEDDELGEGESAHIISNDVLMAEQIYLGHQDKNIPENIPDVDGNSSYGTSNFDKAVYSYNNVFDTLNSKSKEALDTIAGDRDASAEGITKRFRNPSADPLRLEDISSYIVVNSADNFFAKQGFNNKIKKADWDSGTLYNTHQGCDFSKIKSLDIENTTSKANYWLLHREIYSTTWYKYFEIAYVNGEDGTAGRAKLCQVTNGTGGKAEDVSPCGVRPIVVLEHGVLKNAIEKNQGTGTEEDPYILTKIN